MLHICRDIIFLHFVPDFPTGMSWKLMSGKWLRRKATNSWLMVSLSMSMGSTLTGWWSSPLINLLEGRWLRCSSKLLLSAWQSAGLGPSMMGSGELFKSLHQFMMKKSFRWLLFPDSQVLLILIAFLGNFATTPPTARTTPPTKITPKKEKKTCKFVIPSRGQILKSWLDCYQVGIISLISGQNWDNRYSLLGFTEKAEVSGSSGFCFHLALVLQKRFCCSPVEKQQSLRKCVFYIIIFVEESQNSRSSS